MGQAKATKRASKLITKQLAESSFLPKNTYTKHYKK